MSHGTEQQQATGSQQQQQAAPEHDHDAEHDPERARRVSTSMLHRDAAKAKHGHGKQKPAPAEGEMTVSVGVVDLGTGAPRNQIHEHVDTMVGAWNTMLVNLTGAVAQFVGIVQHSQVQHAESGLMAALWKRAEPLLTRAASFVTGTTLGATIGIDAIKRIVAYGDRLEQSRMQADKTAFIDQVYAVEESLKQKGPAEGGMHAVVSKLDQEFVQLGKSNPEDAYKDGDHGVVGAQASFLKELERSASAYIGHVPSKPDFVAQFLQEWISFNHKKRKRSAMRSPFEDSTYQDGYIEVKTTLHYDAAYSGWFIADGSLATATLNCPNSGAVAHALQQSMPQFNLDELDVPIVVELHPADSAWEHMPTHWKGQRDRRIHLSNGMVTSGPKDFWQWAMHEARTSTREILAGIRKLGG